MNRSGIDQSLVIVLVIGILLFTVCPFLFPKIGEQQNSYIQELYFFSIAWIALAHKLLKHKRPLVVRSLDMAIGFCLFALLLHLIWIKPVSLSVWRWVDVAGLAALYLFVRCSSFSEIRIFLGCIMGGGLLQCLYAGIQGIGFLPSQHSAFPMTGSFLNPAPLAGYLAVLTCMLAAFLYLDRRLQGKIRMMIWGVMLLFIFFVLILNSRAALFGMALVTTVVGYSHLKCRRKILYAILLTVGLSLSLYGLYQVREVSANGRLFIWENTCKMLKDHPLTGVGIDRFKAEFPAYQAQYYSELIEEAEKYYDGNTFLVFNEYLRTAAETGMLFPLIFLFPIIIIIKYRNASPECQVAVCGIGCILMFSCFSYPFSIFTLEVLTVLLVASIGRYTSEVSHRKCLPIWKAVVVGMTATVIGIAVYGLMAVHAWNSYQLQPVARGFCYEKYACLFRENIRFIHFYSQQVLENRDTVLALAILDDAIDRIPVAGFYLQRADLYKETGNYLQAVEEYKFLHNLTPTSLEPVYKLALLYQQMGREKEVVELLRPYQEFSLKGRSLEQKAILLEMRELYKKYYCSIKLKTDSSMSI